MPLLVLLRTATCGGAGALEDAEDFVLAHDQELFAVDFDFGTAVFAEENAIADLHVEGLAAAVFLVFTFADGNDFAFLGLLFGSVRDDYSSPNLLAFLNPAHDDAVMKRPDIRSHTLDLLSTFAQNFSLNNDCLALVV